MKFDTIILDASSIINFIRYYHNYFSFNEQKIIFSGLNNFLINKIKTGEIIILDKVFNELRSYDLIEFKKYIKNYVINSLVVFEQVQNLMDKYYLFENEKFYNDNQIKIDNALEKYETTHADLFLIAYANKLKSEGKNVLLITEESFVRDKKLIGKIPVICKKTNENIWCRNIPFALFEFYKEELEFSLNINNS